MGNTTENSSNIPVRSAIAIFQSICFHSP